MFQNKNKKTKLHYATHKKNSGFDNLILIHDNGQSSKLFDSELRFYSSYFKTITVDLTGHGKSEKDFNNQSNFWVNNAEKIIELCDKLNIKKTGIIGTGGGAIVALNMALLKKDLIKSIIADSFVGIEAQKDYIDSLIAYREKIKNSEEKKKYQAMNGFRWEKILDDDTAMQKNFFNTEGNYYIEDLSEISCPILLTGSYANELIPNIETRLKETSSLIKRVQLHFFEKGNHPTVISKNDEFRSLSLKFLIG